MLYDAVVIRKIPTSFPHVRSEPTGERFVVYLRDVDQLDRRKVLLAAKRSSIVKFNRKSGLSVGDIDIKDGDIIVVIEETRKGVKETVGCIGLSPRPSSHHGIDVVAKAENWDLDDQKAT
jgi:hypothetical protein